MIINAKKKKDFLSDNYLKWCIYRSNSNSHHQRKDRERRIEPFLASSIPDLGLDDFALNGDSPGLELNPNSWLGVNAELVLSKPGEQLTLPHRRVSDHYHLEHIIYLLRHTLLVALRRLINPTHFLIHFECSNYCTCFKLGLRSSFRSKRVRGKRLKRWGRGRQG